MTRSSLAGTWLLSFIVTVGVAACGSREAATDSTVLREETATDTQALPVDQGTQADSQALPVDQGATPTNAGDGACASDADCVAAQCCHATSCTLRASAPDCSAAMCTRDCRAGTLDCGGSCYCNQGQCAARIPELGSTPPAAGS